MKGRISKKLLALLLSVAMVMTLTPMVAFGEGVVDEQSTQASSENEESAIDSTETKENGEIDQQEEEVEETEEPESEEIVAKIGEDEYETLAEAIAEVPTNGTPTTIQMIDDEAIAGNMGVTIAKTKNIVLELNGHVISSSANEATTSAVITNYGTLLIQDSTDIKKDGSGTGKITSASSNPDGREIPGYANNTILNRGGTLTIESGLIEVLNSEGRACYAVDNSSNSFGSAYFYMNGGKLYRPTGTTVRQYACSPTDDNYVEVNGGIIENGSGTALQSQFQDWDETKAAKVTIKIKGGTILGENYSWYDYVKYTTPANTFDNATYEFTGGKFAGDIWSYRGEGFLKGGYFTEDVGEYVAEGYHCIINPEYVEESENKTSVSYYPYMIGKKANAVAQIGDNKYETLAEAIAAVKDDETIKMLCDVEGAHGISVPKSTNNKTFTVDFDGHSYSVEKPGAGSAGTTTQAFQLNEGNTIIFKNGIISCTEANKAAVNEGDIKPVKMMIQNYANLTLDNMVIDGTNINREGNIVRYVVSNNSGNVCINDSKIITADNDFAFDSCKYGTYDAPTVTVEGSSEINGKVEATGGNITFKNGAILNKQLRVGENKNGTTVRASIVTIENGATVNGIVAVFGKNTLNVAGNVKGYIATNGNAYNGGSVVNIKDGANIVASGNGVDVPVYIPNGTLNVSGGTITGETAVYFKSTNLNITGGTFIAYGEKKDYKYDGSGCSTTGDALVIDSCNYPNGIENVSVSGGMFKSANGNAIAAITKDETCKPVTKFISGGCFSNKPNATYIVDGKKAVGNTDESTKNEYPWTVGETHEVLVTATSQLVDANDKVISNATIATITGGGMYSSGQSATLTANKIGENSNVSFVGWYDKSGNEVCKSETYVFPVTGAVELVAKYKAGNEAKVDLTVKKTGKAANSGSVTIDGTPISSDSKDITNHDLGKTVVMTANVSVENAYFICWQNSEGAILSTNNTYECPAVQSETVEALFLDEGAAVVYFHDEDSSLLKSKVYAASDSSKVTEVVAPTRRGRTFISWIDNDTQNSLSDTDVENKINSATATVGHLGQVSVTAAYTENQYYTVKLILRTVDGTLIGGDGKPLTVHEPVGVATKLSADAESGSYKLQGFSEHADGTNYFTTAQSFTVSPDAATEEPIVYYAVYGSDDVNRGAAVTVAHPYDASTNVKKIGLTLTWSLPKDAMLESAGFYYGNTKEKLDEGNRVESTIKKPAGSYTLVVNMKNYSDTPILMRGYVTYRLNGETYTVVNTDFDKVESTIANDIHSTKYMRIYAPDDDHQINYTMVNPASN